MIKKNDVRANLLDITVCEIQIIQNEIQICKNEKDYLLSKKPLFGKNRINEFHENLAKVNLKLNDLYVKLYKENEYLDSLKIKN